jgi:hypothetical protein
MAQCLPRLRMNGETVSDEQLLAWLSDESRSTTPLSLSVGQKELPVQHIKRDTLATQFGFVKRPQSDGAANTAGEK